MNVRSTGIAFLLLLARATAGLADVRDQDFGATRDGAPVRQFTITNKGGSAVRVITYGATVVSLTMPDRNGKMADVVLGFDSMEGYATNRAFMGAIVGRYGNRIGGGRFTLDGVEFKVTANERGNTLHGGRRGFDKVLWTGDMIDDQTVEFTYLSKDGEEGFPGNLTARVRYILTDANELKLEYSATSDKDTIVNLTNHSYFNLGGHGSGDVLKHELTINANQNTETDARGIPTGKRVDVAATPFDFRQPRDVGERINAESEQIRFTGGYDINYVLNKSEGLAPAATVYEPTSGRSMDVLTTEPGMQFYSGNGLDGAVLGKEGKAYARNGGLCLETQHFPDSPNQPSFPTTVLRVGQTYQTTTVYRFTTRPAVATQPIAGVHLVSGWVLLREGQAEGTIDAEASHPSNSNKHLLKIAVTKTAGPGEGRAGASNGTAIAVRDGQWYDVTFSALTERNSVGLVFSLEGPDGEVLARTTLPEIGRARGRRGAAATAPATTWQNCRVSLLAQASGSNAHLAITPIEPNTVWLDETVVSPR